MRWTCKLPAFEGYYWFRCDRFAAVELVRVSVDLGGDFVRAWSLSLPNCFRDFRAAGEACFAGPIPHPTGPCPDDHPPHGEPDQTDLGASDDRPLGPDHVLYRG